VTRAFKPFTHQVQWRKRGYWAPGPKFSSEEQAVEYADIRALPEKLGTYRVVPVTACGEPTVDQCLALMKLMQLEPQHWRHRLGNFFRHTERPKGTWSEPELQALQDMGQRVPNDKLFKLKPHQMHNKLEMADARERAVEISKGVQHVVALDQNPDVMTINEGAFVQAWVFVPKRTEEEQRGRDHDIAAYLAGSPRADAA
jgi:hypothetical protein